MRKRGPFQVEKVLKLYQFHKVNKGRALFHLLGRVIFGVASACSLGLVRTIFGTNLQDLMLALRGKKLNLLSQFVSKTLQV